MCNPYQARKCAAISLPFMISKFYYGQSYFFAAMFFVLSKVLYYLVMPSIWIIAALLIALFAKNPKRKKRALAIGLGMMLFFTNPFIANEALLLWEEPPTPMAQVASYDGAIILTGISDQQKLPHDRMYITRGADRVLHPLQLYRMGKVRSFVITGGSGSLLHTYSSEAAEIKRLLVHAGIPAHRILTEEKSRNTQENAQFTAQLLKGHPHLKKLLLVTSAFHMNRASGCFQKAGIKADPFATDFYTSRRQFTPDDFIPYEGALYNWQRLLREMLGYLVYDAIGYL